VEKLHIARGYLIPKKVAEHGLEKGKVLFTDKSILQIIRYYTREAGVRSLERRSPPCAGRSRARWSSTRARSASCDAAGGAPVPGADPLPHGEAEEKQQVGVATGLA